MRKPFTNTVILVVLLTLVAGCGPAAPAAAPVSPTAGPVLATPMPPTATPRPPTATPIPPTATPAPPTAVPAAPPGALTVAVPLGNAPTLDGTLSPGEWDSARREEFSDGSELLLMQNGDHLFLGIRAHIRGVSVWSVFLDHGDEIAVLHSSAALGTAVYKRTQSGWQRTRTFLWTLRDTSNSETARQRRKQYLEKEGWLASLGTMGKPEEAEFQLAMPRGWLRLAVAFLLPPGFDKAAMWPAGLDDDARNIDLLQGDAPAQARFSPERWAVVMVDGSETAGPAPTPASEATPIPPCGRGSQIAFYSDRDGNPELYVMNPDGTDQRRLTFSQFEDSSPDWSPDGSQIAFISDRDDPQAGNCFPDCAYQIYVIQADGSGEHKLVDTESRSLHPDWHPDGTRLSFDTELNLEGDVYVVNADGSGLQRLIHDGFWADWSPDGTQLIFASKRDGNVEIYVADADGGNRRRLTDNSQLDYFPAWSPDGRRIAFARLEKKQIFVMNVDGSDEQQLTHQSNAENPSWSPDGAHIVFQSSGEGNFDIYAIDVEDALEGSGGPAPRRLTENRAAELWPSWGPVPCKGLYLGQTPPGSEDVQGLRITILYDNHLHDERLTSEWGFSALVEVDDRVLLFDTGGSATLMGNMRLLGIDSKTIQAVVLSHEHGDHTDGLLPFLAQANRPPVYLLPSFPARFKNAVAALTSVVEVTDSLEIFPGIYTTGQVTGDVSEQALAIRTDQGSVIITGCAHPGIARMVDKGRSTLQPGDAVQGAPVALAVGGFHLADQSRAQIERVIADLLSLNVQQICPTHCTGDAAIAMFAEAFGEGFIPGGAGKVITLP